MSVNRSNSQVRNLMAVFEKNNSTTPSADSTSPDRGRSNGHLSPGPNGERPLSRVRSSFVSVEPNTPSQAMEIDPEKTKQEHAARQESTAGLRRESFSTDEIKDSGMIAHMRKTISKEGERRDSNPVVAETIPEAAIEATPAATTPAVEAKDYLAAGQHTTNEKPQSKLRDVESANAGGANDDGVASQSNGAQEPMTLPDDDMPADNPDKPVTGVQEEPGHMQPSDLKERSAVSPAPTSDATPVKTDQSEQSKPTPTSAPRGRRGTVTEADAAPAALPHRPAAISTAAPEPTSSTTQPKTPTSAKKTAAPAKKSPAAKPSSALSPKPPVRKPSRTSLAQAKSKPEPAAAAKSKSPQSKPGRPRSPTRPIKMSSHLTAPTASSAAKHDSQAPKAAATSAPKPSASSRPQPRTTAAAAAAKPVARSSLASSSAAPKKTEARPAASNKAPDEGFLARMMRPTASSASRAHEKTDVKSPPKRTPSVVRAKAAATGKPKTAKVEKPGAPQTNGTKSSSAAAPIKEDKQEANEDPFTEESAGASTPQAVSGAQTQEGLEATPAFDTTTIR